MYLVQTTLALAGGCDAREKSMCALFLSDVSLISTFFFSISLDISTCKKKQKRSGSSRIRCVGYEGLLVSYESRPFALATKVHTQA